MQKIRLRSAASFSGFSNTLIVFAGAISLALAIFFAGCAKESDGNGKPEGTIRLAYASNPHASLAHIALAKEFFSSEGLKVEAVPHVFGKLALDAVLEETADVATVAETPIMLAAMKGKKLEINAVIVTSKRNIAIVARKDRGIVYPEDLKNKTIGVTKGTSGEFFLHTFLIAHGIRNTDVRILDLPPDQISEALNQKTIDAAVIWNPILRQNVDRLGENGVVFYEDQLYTEIFGIVTRQNFSKSHPVAMKKFIAALLRAEEFAGRFPSQAQAFVAEYANSDTATIRSIWKDYLFKVSLDQTIIILLEDESRWAMQNGMVDVKTMPNYLEYISMDTLLSIKPESVRIIR